MTVAHGAANQLLLDKAGGDSGEGVAALADFIEFDTRRRWDREFRMRNLA
ncbi:MAG: hypothetical protein KAF42_07585 [Sphingopyxis terrae]|nr:hypothetical protein [Sphingopyxis terrae]